MQTKNSIPSYLSREESTAIKGLLMLLIVFGHIGILTIDQETGSWLFIKSWLYSFHAFTFFLLPFIYGYKWEGTENMNGGVLNLHRILCDLKRNIKRLGTPYCFFFILSIIIFVVVGKGDFHINKVLYAFLMGEQSLLKEGTGFYFLWFLPTMLSLTFLKSLWYNSNAAVKHLLMFLSVSFWLLAISKLVTLEDMGKHVPFALTLALCYLLVGVVVRFLIEKFQAKHLQPWVLLLIFLFTLMMFYRSEIYGATVISYFTFFRLVMPILMFLFIYRHRLFLSKLSVLKLLGHYSLQIYLFNVFVINILEAVMFKFFTPSIGLGFGIFILSVIISTGLAMLIERIPSLNHILFPK